MSALLTKEEMIEAHEKFKEKFLYPKNEILKDRPMKLIANLEFDSEFFIKSIKQEMFNEMNEQEKKLNLEYFATGMEISKATLSRILNGSVPDLQTFLKICLYCNIEMCDLFKAYSE